MQGQGHVGLGVAGRTGGVQVRDIVVRNSADILFICLEFSNMTSPE